MSTEHYRSVFNQHFQEIRDDLLRMGEEVDTAIVRALEALKHRDVDLARQVIATDTQIDALRYEIEEECLVLIATQQPTASDLRAVIVAMNLATEMERIADHAEGIAKTVVRAAPEPLLKPLIDIPRMVDMVRDMLRRALQAFLDHDAEAARAIAAQDDEIDRMYKAIFDELLEIMAKDPSTISRATYLLWCGHNLERIGDRITNITERVIFMTTGSMRDLKL